MLPHDAGRIIYSNTFVPQANLKSRSNHILLNPSQISFSAAPSAPAVPSPQTPVAVATAVVVVALRGGVIASHVQTTRGPAGGTGTPKQASPTAPVGQVKTKTFDVSVHLQPSWVQASVIWLSVQTTFQTVGATRALRGQTRADARMEKRAGRGQS
jgi:hypothetical protein